MWSWSSAAFRALSASSSSVIRLTFTLSAQDRIDSKRWMMMLSRRFASSRGSRRPVLRRPVGSAGASPGSPGAAPRPAVRATSRGQIATVA